MAPRYDVAVIGAGIHGAGVAQAAAAAGHRVLVLEKSEPAAGTSSKSSKLIHGGLRYLETPQFGLVRESLRERELLLRLAPGLVTRLPFYIPVYASMARGPLTMRAGLSLYALLGGLAPAMRFRSLPRAAWGSLGPLSHEGLRAVFAYRDARADDAALVRAVLDSAKALGATVEMPARLESASRREDGWVLRLADGTERFASVVVNAAGPWVAQVQRRAGLPAVDVELVQGAHVEYDAPISEGAIYVESPVDRRPVFLLPWRGGTLVGTTETLFRGNPDDVTPLPGEIDYLEATLRRYVPEFRGRRTGAWAGLRVLPRSATDPNARRRGTMFVTDEPAAPRWIAVCGGKLTTYRETAGKVMRLAAPSLPARTGRDTATIPLGS
ncbi:MAG TPA: FAD-dependent oxidoreductase [Candidatus Polarisedimenticolaceae bacterium]